VRDEPLNNYVGSEYDYVSVPKSHRAKEANQSFGAWHRHWRKSAWKSNLKYLREYGILPYIDLALIEAIADFETPNRLKAQILYQIDPNVTATGEHNSARQGRKKGRTEYSSSVVSTTTHNNAVSWLRGHFPPAQWLKAEAMEEIAEGWRLREGKGDQQFLIDRSETSPF
jgi:hypothetical protein